MCGIFSWKAMTTDDKVDLRYLKRLAVNTEKRGPHAFGFSWIDATGTLNHYKQQGRISKSLYTLNILKRARAIIGHCRWVTQGDAGWNPNNHPHRIGRGWLVHNGRIPEYENILRDNNIRPQTECDSEVLGHLYCRQGGDILNRIANTVTCTQSDIAIMGLWARPRRMVVYRQGKPLHFSNDDSGLYFASLPDELYQPKLIKAGEVTLLKWKDRKTSLESVVA